MINRAVACATLIAAASFIVPADAGELRDANGNLDALITKHAAANGIPESLVRRIIKLRKMEPEKSREEDELLELYKSAIGMR